MQATQSAPGIYTLKDCPLMSFNETMSQEVTEKAIAALPVLPKDKEGHSASKRALFYARQSAICIVGEPGSLDQAVKHEANKTKIALFGSKKPSKTKAKESQRKTMQLWFSFLQKNPPVQV